MPAWGQARRGRCRLGAECAGARWVLCWVGAGNTWAAAAHWGGGIPIGCAAWRSTAQSFVSHHSQRMSLSGPRHLACAGGPRYWPARAAHPAGARRRRAGPRRRSLGEWPAPGAAAGQLQQGRGSWRQLQRPHRRPCLLRSLRPGRLPGPGWRRAGCGAAARRPNVCHAASRAPTVPGNRSACSSGAATPCSSTARSSGSGRPGAQAPGRGAGA